MPTTNAFVSYAHADEKTLSRLRTHLAMLRRDGNISAWTDHLILPGDIVTDTISANLESSTIFIALLSPDYLASNYCYEKEFKRALALSATGKLRIVPVILKPCDWLSSPFQQFLALPKDGRAISSWADEDDAFLDVVIGLRRVLAAPASGPDSVTRDVATSTIRFDVAKITYRNIDRRKFVIKIDDKAIINVDVKEKETSISQTISIGIHSIRVEYDIYIPYHSNGGRYPGDPAIIAKGTTETQLVEFKSGLYVVKMILLPDNRSFLERTVDFFKFENIIQNYRIFVDFTPHADTENSD